MTRRRLVATGIALAALALAGAVAWAVVGTPGAVLQDEPTMAALPTPSGRDFVTVPVREGETAGDVGERLEEKGVIRSSRQFRILVSLMGVSGELQAGDYELDRGLPALTVIGRLRRGETLPLSITVPEGLRVEEVAELLEKGGIVPADEFLEALSVPYDLPLLSHQPDGVGLEGYLFPATYRFSRAVTGEDVVREMLTTFDDRVSEDLRRDAGTQGLTLHQLTTLASIVEREAVNPYERPVIASVFLNRLRQGMPLAADPTVQYAVAADPAGLPGSGWWKQDLTLDDLAVDSPYNTYVNAGLPPGPIAGPGLASIEAVARPAETDFLYFVARPDGSHAFARTLEEHELNVEQYQR